jgi:outer membrane protein OmpA-like peptidoglycan-associated protein
MKKLIPFALLSFAALGFSACTNLDKPDGFEGNQPPPVTTGQAVGNNLPPPSDGLADRAPITNTFKLFDEQTGEYDARAIVATVYFGYDKYSVSASSRGDLDRLAKGTRLIAAGYADYYGTEQYNTGLSDKRAQSVINYLAGSGHSGGVEKQAFGKQYAKLTGSRDAVARDRKVVVVNADYQPPK